MAAFDTSRTAYGSSAAASSLISRMFASVVSWNDARVTRKALSSLTDRELEDIGLIRGDIEGVAQTSFFR
ncbi:DUF1127 domain containing protein [Sulfitobacter noctilucicola]|uniref:Uncharacterized protein YjiS (DUF1127 family) n=1 Tax=Sulfitobacter noctilucicola TaxID=1342301 RepID=A0A7W6M933_9RHOB|nr:DUF1127 domain-containing protein [Sulfitobacter noctilucicola]KIN63790.1 DUF1127 domain containing protein [Sulfitobacter noctilucicola]MBB4174701.1 uncharacterized protein YjiS (DUF1127 family) [Sulfitobacter noctilucicola]